MISEEETPGAGIGSTTATIRPPRGTENRRAGRGTGTQARCCGFGNRSGHGRSPSATLWPAQYGKRFVDYISGSGMAKRVLLPARMPPTGKSANAPAPAARTAPASAPPTARMALKMQHLSMGPNSLPLPEDYLFDDGHHLLDAQRGIFGRLLFSMDLDMSRRSDYAVLDPNADVGRMDAWHTNAAATSRYCTGLL